MCWYSTLGLQYRDRNGQPLGCALFAVQLLALCWEHARGVFAGAGYSSFSDVRLCVAILEAMHPADTRQQQAIVQALTKNETVKTRVPRRVGMLELRIPRPADVAATDLVRTTIC